MTTDAGARPRPVTLTGATLPRDLVTRFRRLGLRSRITALFALGAVGLSALLATVTWSLASSYMLSQRENGAARQAEANAIAVSSTLLTDPAGVDEVLTGLASGPYSATLLWLDNRWLVSEGSSIAAAHLPTRLVNAAHSGIPVRQRVVVDGIPRLLVALPVPGTTSTYVEVFPLVELNRVFRFLSSTLVAAALVTTLLGVALGRWASRRVLRPLEHLDRAARSVAAGDLSTRLPSDNDTHLASLADAFNDMTASLQERTVRDARFASDVSHELRSPLMTMVNAMAVLTRRRDELPEAAVRAVDLLASDVERFSRMVTDLLEISRIDQGFAPRPDEQIDLVDLTARTCGAGSDRAVPVVELPAAPVVVTGDRRRLEQVLVNLLDNARLHAGGATRVAVSVRSGCGRVEVDDDGPGVPVTDRKTIFERFKRGGDRMRALDDTGSGLGLALVVEHVRVHHGRVWVETCANGGARFVVEIPLRC